jgi:hypothetical protein
VWECRLFTRYLIGQEPPADCIERYRRACEVLFHDSPGASSAATLSFLRRHSWALPCLDAAAGFCQRDDPLRKKLLVCTAILEATPAFSEHFLGLQQNLNWLSVLARAAWNGLSSTCKAVAGLLLWRFVAGR